MRHPLSLAALLLSSSLAWAADEAPKLGLPARVTANGPDANWFASGYMGDHASIKQELSTDRPKEGKDCLHVSFTGTSGWGGVMWQNPANDWGDKAGGFNLQGASKLSLWVRGEAGGEEITFGFGGLGKDKPFSDTATGSRKVTLTKDWQQVIFDVAAEDLTRIKTGLMWVGAADNGAFGFFIDDVKWE